MSDFILCTGVVISNMNLARMVTVHVANKKRDPNHIMTVLLQETTPAHRRKDKCDESVYFIEPSSSRLLALNSHALLPKAKNIVIQPHVITDHPEVELRADLTDTNISICSPDVLALFTENFDYHTMRRDFIHGILESDILGKTIYAHVLAGSSSLPGEHSDTASWDMASQMIYGDSFLPVSRGGYAASVTDTAAYDAISRDIIGRWAYPLCPDNGPGDGLVVYSHNRGAVYKVPSVRLDRQSRVEHHVILGAESHVSNFTSISDSVLGARCFIGEKSVVRGSYLFNDTRVGQGSLIEQSILGERVKILDNVTIERGCIIGDDVTIGPNVRIPAFTRLARRKLRRKAGSPEIMQEDSDEEDEEDSTWTESAQHDEVSPVALSAESEEQELFDKQAVGVEGVGYVWSDSPEGADAAEFGDGFGSDESDANSSSDGYSDEEDDVALRLRQLHTIGSTLEDVALLESDHEDEHLDDSDGEHDQDLVKLSPQEEFERELYLTIKRACEENLSASKSALEIKSLRMSYHRDQDDMRASVVQEIFRTIDLGSISDSTVKVLRKWAPVIKDYISDGHDQLDLMDIIERYCALEGDIDSGARCRLFVRIVYMSYQLDLLEDVAIIAWHNRAHKAGTEVDPGLLQALQPVVDGLNESDDSDEDDSEDEESESEEDGDSE
ncbi:translation initiation factor eIF-2B epsilon subunit, GEF [Coemansia guatemalensis]|uniref:Translation initiation factor eIF2B subunit epsilon n=1 Tax=Coemansia guatemalensis TaxID=2761395 RepID=A0A9W8HQP0_9FUNG|nr:translation initiation factor eIF-2B epsilon subunit, GEF [Coemansia guatemalensis]